MFYISALVLGVIVGAFVAVIVSSFRPNRARDLYNQTRKSSKNDSLRRGSCNIANVNSVLDNDNLWSGKDQNSNDAEDSVDETSNPVSFKRANKSKKVYIAGSGIFNASQFHGGAPEGIATIEVNEDQVKPIVKMVEQHPDFIRQAFAMSGKRVITLGELMDIWEVLSGDKVSENAC